MLQAKSSLKRPWAIALDLSEFLGQALFWVGLGLFLAQHYKLPSDRVAMMVGFAGIFVNLVTRMVRAYYSA